MVIVLACPVNLTMKIVRSQPLQIGIFFFISQADQQTLLRIHQMIILPALRYGDASYGSASPKTLKILDPVHHKGVRLAMGTFTVC
jgi:hypothetical protein